ncbi:MAG: hypothetical protein ACYSW3_25325 [Planctomycetota bacterium]|jgi:hypothetical protein
MKVYVVWRMHHAPLEVFTKHRKAEALVVLLARDGVEAFIEPCTLNEATPEPIQDPLSKEGEYKNV